MSGGRASDQERDRKTVPNIYVYTYERCKALPIVFELS